MKKYSQFLKELPTQSIVVCYSEFQPPTVVHEQLIKTAKKISESTGSKMVVYTTKKQDKKNPLTEEKKLKYLELLFPNIKVETTELSQTQLVKSLSESYKKVTFVTFSDSTTDAISKVASVVKINESESEHSNLLTKVRSYASRGMLSEFKQQLPGFIREIDSKRIMNDVRIGMGLEPVKEQIVLQRGEIREKYFRGEIFNVGEVVESAGVKYEIVKRGSNHLLLKEESGKLVSKWIQDVSICEDVAVGYVPKEITFGGYTTKSLHHSADAASAFLDTIKRYGDKYPAKVLDALMATDTYMHLSDMHLEQGKPPSETEKDQWIKAHDHAKQHLEELGEFLHHRDYWDNHMHEMEDMLSNYKEEGKSEMSEELKVNEELTDKTIKPTDKIKVARIIATMLGDDKAESSSNPEMLINNALRKVRSKALNPEALRILDKMLNLATETGIQYDGTLKPAKLKETKEVDKDSDYNIAGDTLRYSDYRKLTDMTRSKPGHSLGSTDETNRKMKIKHQLGEESLAEEHIVHVDDGSKYGDQPHDKDVDHVMSGAKKHGGTFDGHSDKGAYFKFKTQSGAKNFVNHVKLAPHRTVHADLHEAVIRPRTKEQMTSPETLALKYSLYSKETLTDLHKKGDWRARKELENRTKNEDTEETIDKPQLDEISQKLAGDYYGAATKKHIDKVGIKPNMYGRIEKDMGKQRKAGIDRAMDRITGARKTNEEAELDEGVDKDHPIVKEYDSLKKNHDIKSLRNLIKTQHRIIDTSEFRTKDHAISHYLRAKHGNKKVADAFGLKEDFDSIEEAIKEPTGGLKDACWDGYTAVGMKMKNGKKVPNCVPKEEAMKTPVDDDDHQIGAHNSKGFDAFFEEEDLEDSYEDISDEELEKMADEVQDVDHIIDAYDDEELSVVDDETGEEIEDEEPVKEEALMEVLSRMERMRARMRLARTKAKRERALKIAVKRYSSSKVINKRSRRLAIKLMKKRLLRGRDMTKLSVGEKERIERMIEKRKPIINRLAMKLAPRVRKIEKSRMSHSKFTQGAQNVAF